MASLKLGARRLVKALHWSALYGWWYRLQEWDPRLRLRKARFRRWNRAAAADEMVVRPGLRLRIDAQSRQPFEWFCYRSLEMARELDAFRREMAACRRFVDVGACHGIFSLAFVHDRPEAMAVAVEPSAIACSILAENIRLAGNANVVVKQVACGLAAGTLAMRQVWHHLEALPEAAGAAMAAAAATAAAIAAPEAVIAPDAVTVPVQSLDGLCAELDLRPDLIKIDVEGYELAVLAGAREILGRDRPALFLELHPQWLRELGSSAAEVVRLVEALGYRFHRLDGSPLAARQVASRESVSRVICTALP